MLSKINLCIFAITIALSTASNAAFVRTETDGVKEYVTRGADDDEIYTIWTRIRDGFQVPNMENAVVDENLERYTKRPDYLQRMANRSSKYLYHIIEEVESRGMPTEIALLPFVESAFVTNAKSRVKAAGLWQFMPSTGKIYDLDQTMWKDSRYDVLQSTSAALTYLQKLYDEFGDWPLALAAYNWGEGNVRRAIKKNQVRNLPTDYMSLKMPNETRNYYPKLQAIKHIVLNPEKYGVKLPAVYNEPYFVQVFKDQDIDVAKAAQLAQMSKDEFNSLNPSFNRPVIVASHNHSLLMPTDKIDTFIENLVSYRTSGKPLSSWTTYRVKEGDTIASIAKRANMTENTLREANQIPPGRRVKPGSVLLVNKGSSLGNGDDISSDTIDAQIALVQDYRRVTYRVRRGDTLQRVARRLGVSPHTIVASNKIKGRKLRVGQTLVVNVPVVTRQVASKQPTTSSSSRFYVVRKGDTLYAIASRYHVAPSALRNANNLKDNRLVIGQRLVINQEGQPMKKAVVLNKVPESVQKQANDRPLAKTKTYRVKKGDTLFSIASSANMSVNELKKINQMTGNTLRVGQTLKLSH